MNSIKSFQEKKICSVWNEKEQQWYFSVVDIVGVLTDCVNPTDYLKKIRKRGEALATYLGTNCPQVVMMTETGKKRKTLAANVQALFRIIQSVPSSKAEPFKLWLAQVGYERVQEIENPELAQERMTEMYEPKGYPKDWIDKRLRGIAIRQNLTDEWKERRTTEKSDYAIFMAAISKATFGLAPSDYKIYKGLTKINQNIHDRMSDLELIFTMPGERATTEISQKEKSDTFTKSKQVAQRGRNVVGVAREQAEKELGRSIIFPDNFLLDSKKRK